MRTRYLTQELIKNNWICYCIFVIIWDLLVVPAAIFLNTGIIVWIIVVAQFPLMVGDLLKYEVAEKDPRKFLNGERLKAAVSYAYLLLLSLLFGSVFAELVADKFGVQQLTAPLINLFTISLFLFTGATLYSTSMSGLWLQKPRHLLRTRARAFLRVASESLSSEDQKVQAQGLPFLKRGMDNYSPYFEKRFGFAVREPRRYYDYVRLVVSSGNRREIERIRKALDALTCRLTKDVGSFDNLWATKNILGETLWNLREAYCEVEFKVGLRKWYSLHQDSARMIVMVASLVVSLIALVIRYM